MLNKFEKFFVFFIIFLISLGIYAFYNKIYYPANLSVISACNDINETELNEMGYSTVGTYNNSNQQITNNYDCEIYPEQFKKVMKHEYCHYIQDINGKSFSCNKLYRMKFLFGEMQCYLAEYTPDFIYNKIYKTNF